MSPEQSDIFEYNLMFWKVFGIWPGNISTKYYRYYSFVYLFTTFFLYNVFLTLNLLYTPPKIELIIREVIFYFTEIVVAAKIFTILLMRSKIINVLKLLNIDEFKGEDEITKAILGRSNRNYKACYKLYSILSNLGYSTQVLVPIFLNLILRKESEKDLPICKYYFLSDDVRESYYVYWFLYQSFGMYGHMMYNVNIDTFIVGLLLMAITQVKMLKFKLSTFELTSEERKMPLDAQDIVQMFRLNCYLKHYDSILEFCSIIQKMFSVMMFVQFGISSTIICVVMCGLLLPSSTESFVFMVIYLIVMTMQIFLPCYLGTQFTHESQDLVFAAYNSDWIPRSEPFKRSLNLFMQRANIPIVITGLNMFPLSLVTFTSIMKTAYSFFTLIRNVQDQQQ